MAQPEPQISLPDSSTVTKTIFETMNSDNATALADVTLITSDNMRIPAVRMLLSMGSSYFRTLLSSEFAEKNTSEVTVSIAARLLREILEFIYTDDCNTIRVIRGKQTQGIVECKDVSAIVELADAADYTCVERLVSRCKEVVRCVMRKSPHTACATVQALVQGRLTWGKQLINEAVKICREKPGQALFEEYKRCDLSCGLMHLDERTAEDVFSCGEQHKIRQENAKTTTLFEALVAWASGGTAVLIQPQLPPWGDFNVRIDTEGLKIMEVRLKPAKRFALSFDVSYFPPGFIANVVERSGLLETEVLCHAYREQALDLEHLKRNKGKQMKSYGRVR